MLWLKAIHADAKFEATCSVNEIEMFSLISRVRVQGHLHIEFQRVQRLYFKIVKGTPCRAKACESIRSAPAAACLVCDEDLAFFGGLYAPGCRQVFTKAHEPDLMEFWLTMAPAHLSVAVAVNSISKTPPKHFLQARPRLMHKILNIYCRTTRVTYTRVCMVSKQLMLELPPKEKHWRKNTPCIEIERERVCVCVCV